MKLWGLHTIILSFSDVHKEGNKRSEGLWQKKKVII